MRTFETIVLDDVGEEEFQAGEAVHNAAVKKELAEAIWQVWGRGGRPPCVPAVPEPALLTREEQLLMGIQRALKEIHWCQTRTGRCPHISCNASRRAAIFLNQALEVAPDEPLALSEQLVRAEQLLANGYYGWVD